MEDGRQARFLFLPQGEDPDSLVRAAGKDAFLNLIKDQALSLDGFLFKHLQEGLNLETMDGRARLAKLAAPYLEKLPSGLFHQLLIQRLAEITGLDSQYLSSHFEAEATLTDSASHKVSPDHRVQPTTSPVPTTEVYPRVEHSPSVQPNYASSTRSRPALSGQYSQRATLSTRIGLSGYAIRQLLCNSQLVKTFTASLDSLVLPSDPDNTLLIDLVKTLSKKPTLSASALIAGWYGTENGQRLEALATMDHGREVSSIEFQETMERIQQKSRNEQQKAKRRELLNRLRDKTPAQINQEHRRELAEFHDIERKKHDKAATNEKK